MLQVVVVQNTNTQPDTCPTSSDQFRNYPWKSIMTMKCCLSLQCKPGCALPGGMGRKIHKKKKAYHENHGQCYQITENNAGSQEALASRFLITTSTTLARPPRGPIWIAVIWTLAAAKRLTRHTDWRRRRRGRRRRLPCLCIIGNVNQQAPLGLI